MTTCSTPEIHVGNVDVNFGIRLVEAQTGVPVDLSTATSLAIRIRRPDGSTFDTAATASAHEDDEGGILSIASFLSTASTFTVPGDHAAQAIVELTSGKPVYSKIAHFRVHGNL